MTQARFQAQQLAEREEKLIHLLEQRQDEAIRRVAYNNTNSNRDGGGSANSYSANSASSNNRWGKACG